jgi:hypothetical protein
MGEEITLEELKASISKLRANIYEILNKPDCQSPNTPISETHFLVCIPKKVKFKNPTKHLREVWNV